MRRQRVVSTESLIHFQGSLGIPIVAIATEGFTDTVEFFPDVTVGSRNICEKSTT